MQKIYVEKIYSYQNCVKHRRGGGAYRTANYSKFKNQVIEQLDDSFVVDADAALSLDLVLYFKLPKGKSKKFYEENDKTWCQKHIDLDNIAKLVNDVISDFYSFDDANICYLNVQKIWYFDEDFSKDYFTFEIKNI